MRAVKLTRKEQRLMLPKPTSKPSRARRRWHLRPEYVRRDPAAKALLAEHPRPRTRGACLPGGANEARPCPYVSCQYHLFLDVDPDTGRIRLNFPDREVHELEETCALDVADGGALTLEEEG